MLHVPQYDANDWAKSSSLQLFSLHCSVRGWYLACRYIQGTAIVRDFAVAGLDTCLAIMRVLHEGLGDGKYRPCPLLVQYVDAGWWGKKVGKGVFEYPGWDPKDAKPVPLARV